MFLLDTNVISELRRPERADPVALRNCSGLWADKLCSAISDRGDVHLISGQHQDLLSVGLDPTRALVAALGTGAKRCAAARQFIHPQQRRPPWREGRWTE